MEQEESQTRPDITCPIDGELIPLDKMSIKKFTDKIYFIWCPRCRGNHTFNPK